MSATVVNPSPVTVAVPKPLPPVGEIVRVGGFPRALTSTLIVLPPKSGSAIASPLLSTSSAPMNI